MDKQLEIQLIQYFDGTIAVADWESLQARMLSDPDVRQAFIRLCRREAFLVELLQEEAMGATPIGKRDASASSQLASGYAHQAARARTASLRRQRCGRRPAPWCCKTTFLATAAACLIIVVGVMWYDRKTTEAQPYTIATLIQAVSDVEVIRGGAAQFLGIGTELQPEDHLTTGLGAATLRYQLDHTEVELQPHTTATLMPATPERGSRSSLLVHEGRVRCAINTRLPHHPFVVTTAHAQMVVLGTVYQLTVDVVQTRLDVIQGQVRITLSSDESRFQVLTAGQSAIATHDSLRLIDTVPAEQALQSEPLLRASDPTGDVPLVINETWEGGASRSRWMVMNPPNADSPVYTGPEKQPPVGWPLTFVVDQFDGQPAAIVSSMGLARFVLRDMAGSGPLRFKAQPGRITIAAQWQLDLLPASWRTAPHETVFLFSLDIQGKSPEVQKEESKQESTLAANVNRTYHTELDLELERVDAHNLRGVMTVTHTMKRTGEIIGTNQVRIVTQEGSPVFPFIQVRALTFRLGEVIIRSDLPVIGLSAESDPAPTTTQP